MPPPTEELEAAIKLLQRNGYEVFRRSAGLKLSTVHLIDNSFYHRHGGEGGGYMQSMRQDCTRRIGDELRKAELIEFGFVPSNEDGVPYGLQRTGHTATLHVFPATRKEWRR